MYIQITTYPPPFFQVPFSSASKMFSAIWLWYYSQHHWLIFKDLIESRNKVLGMGTYSYLTYSPFCVFLLLCNNKHYKSKFNVKFLKKLLIKLKKLKKHIWLYQKYNYMIKWQYVIIFNAIIIIGCFAFYFNWCFWFYMNRWFGSIQLFFWWAWWHTVIYLIP